MTSSSTARGDTISLWTWMKLAVIALALIGLAAFGLAIVAGLAAAGVIVFFVHRLFRGRRAPTAWRAVWPKRAAQSQTQSGPDGAAQKQNGPVIEVDYRVETDPPAAAKDAPHA